VVLGVDRHGGYSYIHFPLFCGADLRVYRQKIEEQADSEPECAPVKVCFCIVRMVDVQFDSELANLCCISVLYSSNNSSSSN